MNRTGHSVRRQPASPINRRRRGTITIELLLNLPIWLLAILALVEFGEVAADLQSVSMASRVGAEEASQTLGLPSTGEVPAAVVDAVERALTNSGLGCSKIILEHNLSGTSSTLVSGSGPGRGPDVPLPEAGAFVRVTVVVPATGITPSILQRLGFDWSSRVFGRSAVFRYVCPLAEVQ